MVVVVVVVARVSRKAVERKIHYKHGEQSLILTFCRSVWRQGGGGSSGVRGGNGLSSSGGHGS